MIPSIYKVLKNVEENCPLGANFRNKGTTFALYAPLATKVELCLFDVANGEMPIATFELFKKENVWEVDVEGVFPGQLYGYRVYGPFNPVKGLRFNHHKLLIDPYAKAITTTFSWHPSLYGYPLRHAASDLIKSVADSAPYAPKSIVVDSDFNWQKDRSPEIDPTDRIIYEVHVKGFSKLNRNIPEHLRGTYLGLAHPVSIAHLKSLGVTTVQLLPVHHFLTDHYLEEKNLVNYWGYNSIGFFAPHASYSSNKLLGAAVNAFKEMVRLLHLANIEVFLDVVYNHTAEGNEKGATLSFKGLDNQHYYRLDENPRYYSNFTGTGNAIDASNSASMNLILDSLKYWVQEMHVDGFRFDLATTLARNGSVVNYNCQLFEAIKKDPVLSKLQLIAEPWDVGPDGYQLGAFPSNWAEWNGKFRDDVRRFWVNGEINQSIFNHLLGSPDVFKHGKSSPLASINFITAHDGFTLLDLLSYNEKHNELNGEANKDGEDVNFSFNHGIEGDTNDARINAMRSRQQRNLLMCLMLAQGVPMICAGDEIGRTQQGNNNAYCQDNAISYLNWAGQDKALFDFTRRLISIRKSDPIFRSPHWLDKNNTIGRHTWLMRTGKPRKEITRQSNAFILKLSGTDNYYLAFNGAQKKFWFTVPGKKLEVLLATTNDLKRAEQFEENFYLEAKSMVLLKEINI